MYDISKATTELSCTNKLSAASKRKYQAIREGKAMTQTNLQSLANSICDDFGVPRCPVSYSGKQPHSTAGNRLRAKTYGNYSPRSFRIKLYKYTARTQKVVANKTLLNTLIHELCHHFDFQILKLKRSPHTSGFYTRISTLEKALQQ